jgi:hypothetical protein
MATRPDKNSPFTNITNLTGVNSSVMDAHPYVSPDGLTLYFDSDRNGNGQLFKATRESLDAPFDTPEHLSFFDSPRSSLWCPSLSSDGTALYFVRWPANDMTDMYVSYISDIPEVKTYYVDVVNGNDLDNGLSPEAAFASIQKGIDTAEHGDKVIVCPGVYAEEVNFNGKPITVQSAAEAAILENPNGFAVSFKRSEGPDSVLRNLVIRNSLMGIVIAGSSPTICNVTVVDNTFGIAAYAGSEPDISNSIFWNNTYSDLAGCDAWYSCTKEEGAGENNIEADPLFADPNNDDYHLLSERGRYWPLHDVWVLDKVTSPCIDGGDPAVDPSGEPIPNGGRINMGAYAGTRYASMSEMQWLDADVNLDGLVDISDVIELIEKWLEVAGWDE